MSSVLLLSHSPAFEMQLRAALGPDATVGRLQSDDLDADTDTLADSVAEARPDIVCLGPDGDVDDLLAIAANLDREHPSIGLMLIGELNADLWQRAMRAGVGTVVPEGADADDIRLAVARVEETSSLRRAANRPRDDAEPRGIRRIVTVLSPKGGSGKTTIATNVAVSLAHASPGRVALVDLDLQFGDVSAALHLSPEHTLADVGQCGEKLDSTALKVFLTPHPSSLFALCSPETPAEADEVGYEDAARALTHLSEEFPTVVVDTSSGLAPETLAAIEVSTDLVFVCSLDVPAVRGLRKELDALDRLGMTTQRRTLVLNRADSKVGLAADDVQEVLGLPIEASVPSSRDVTISMNEGVPVVESRPRTPAARELQRLASFFAEPSRATVNAGAGGDASKRGWRKSR